MILLLVGLWRKKHKHIATFQLGRLLNDSYLGARLGEASHGFQSDFGMSHFTSSESDRSLYLIAVLEEFESIVELGIKIVCVDIERKTHFLDINDMLIFSGFLLSLSLFKTVLAVVHNLAYGRVALRSDLDEVKVFLLCDRESFLC